MASDDDGNSLLGIPGAWISTGLDLNLSSPASLTPHPSIQPAYISALKEPPTLPPSCDPLLHSSMIGVRSTPHASYPALGLREFDLKVRRGSFGMPAGFKTAAEATPQSILPPFDAVSNASSTLLTSPIDATAFSPPKEPGQALSGDTASIRSGVSRFSFGPSTSGSPLFKCNSDFGFPTVGDDLGCKDFASRESFDHSAVDAFPPSPSINPVLSIPSIASDLHLRNLPITEEQPLEPHSAYFSAVEGDSVISRSDDGPDPAHDTSSSSASALDLCIPSAEEAHHQIFWQEHPSPRRRTVRIEVRTNALQQGAIRRESFTYACKSLPYDAGLRPHAYVDNREHPVHGKHHLEAMDEDVYAMDEFTEEEDHVTGKSKRPTIFRKLVEGKRLSKLMGFGPLKFQKSSKRFSVQSHVPEPRSPAVFSSVLNFADHATATPDDPNIPPTPSPPSPPLFRPTPGNQKHRALFKNSWSSPRSLSLFFVPKPKVEGKIVPSPKELSMCLPADDSISPLTSPQMPNTEIHQTDVHGRPYGPSRVAIPDLSPKSPYSPIAGHKQRRSWLANLRSPKTSPLVV